MSRIVHKTGGLTEVCIPQSVFNGLVYDGGGVNTKNLGKLYHFEFNKLFQWIFSYSLEKRTYTGGEGVPRNMKVGE